jgi:hypothetical protein
LTGRGGDLRADPAGADDHHSLALSDSPTDQLRVDKGTEVMNAGEIGARDVEAAGHRPGCDEEPVVAEPAIALQQELLKSGVEARNAGRAPEVDVVVLIEAFAVDVRLRRSLAPQVVLRERRALVWPLGLIAEQDQATIVPLVAQGFGGLCAGQPGADDGDGLGV